jgi:erythromycin esterase
MTVDPEPCSGELLADWFRAHASKLATLDPHAPLDELEPLREIVGDARVVAVGESAHFVEEFSLTRARVLRFLAERCGFTVFAFEFGFSEAFALDQWLQGAGDEADLAAASTAAGVDAVAARSQPHQRPSPAVRRHRPARSRRGTAPGPGPGGRLSA